MFGWLVNLVGFKLAWGLARSYTMAAMVARYWLVNVREYRLKELIESSWPTCTIV